MQNMFLVELSLLCQKADCNTAILQQIYGKTLQCLCINILAYIAMSKRILLHEIIIK